MWRRADWPLIWTCQQPPKSNDLRQKADTAGYQLIGCKNSHYDMPWKHVKGGTSLVSNVIWSRLQLKFHRHNWKNQFDFLCRRPREAGRTSELTLVRWTTCWSLSVKRKGKTMNPQNWSASDMLEVDPSFPLLAPLLFLEVFEAWDNYIWISRL